MFSSNQMLRLHARERSYHGVVVSASEDALLVATPLREDPGYPVGEPVELELPLHDGVYRFASRVIGTQLLPHLVFVLAMPAALRREQRRAHPRIPARVPAQLIYISSEASFHASTESWDLARGGLGIRAPDALEEGRHCVVLLELNGQGIQTICRVARCVPHPEGGYLLGLRFAEMSEADRAALEEWLVLMGRN